MEYSAAIQAARNICQMSPICAQYVKKWNELEDKLLAMSKADRETFAAKAENENTEESWTLVFMIESDF